jgi:hypothetical protein
MPHDQRPHYWTLDDRTHDLTMRQILAIGGLTTACLLVALGSWNWALGVAVVTGIATVALIWWRPFDPALLSPADLLAEVREGYDLLEQGGNLKERRRLLLELKAEIDANWPANRPPGHIDNLAHERKHWQTNWNAQLGQEEDLAGQQAALVTKLRHEAGSSSLARAR